MQNSRIPQAPLDNCLYEKAAGKGGFLGQPGAALGRWFQCTLHQFTIRDQNRPPPSTSPQVLSSQGFTAEIRGKFVIGQESYRMLHVLARKTWARAWAGSKRFFLNVPRCRPGRTTLSPSREGAAWGTRYS